MDLQQRFDRLQARVATAEASLTVCADATLEHTLALDKLQTQLTQLQQTQQQMQLQVTQLAQTQQQSRLTQLQVQQTQQQMQEQITQQQHTQQQTQQQLTQIRQRLTAVREALGPAMRDAGSPGRR